MTLKALAAHAYGLMALGQDDGAIDAMRTAHGLQMARFGALHLDSLFLQNELGFMLAATDRNAEAEPVFESLVRNRAAVWGAGAIQLVPPLSNLANARMRLGKLEEALVDADRALAILNAQDEAPLPMRVIVMRGRVDILRELGRLEAAEAQYRAAVATAAALPEGDLRRLALDGAWARLLEARGEIDQALGLIERTIAAMREQINDGNPMLRTLLADQLRLLAHQATAETLSVVAPSD